VYRFQSKVNLEEDLATLCHQFIPDLLPVNHIGDMEVLQVFHKDVETKA
jgi:hypothetical protein